RDLAQAVDDFLLRDLLELADPHLRAAVGQAPDKDITLRKILDRAAARIPGRFPDQPLVEAAVRRTVGNTYQGLGEYELARTHLEGAYLGFQRELGHDDLRTLECAVNLADVYSGLSEYAKAEPMYIQVYETRRLKLGEDHEDTLAAKNDLGEMARLKGNLT